MKLAAQNPKSLFEQTRIEVQFSRDAKKREVIAAPSERQNLRALRTEVDVDGRSATAGPANLQSRGR
jgi:hypothetical protein